MSKSTLFAGRDNTIAITMITKAMFNFFILYILYSYGEKNKCQWHEHALTVPVRLAIAIVTGCGCIRHVGMAEG